MSEKGSVLEALNRRKRAAFRAANSAKALVHAALLEAPSSERSNEVAVRLDSWNICLGEISDVIASILDNTDLKGKSADQLEVIEGKMYEQWQQSKEEYDLAKSKLNTMNDFLNPKGSNRRSLDSSLVTDTAPANPLVKLPDLPVPKFSGKTKDFTEWYSLFQAMIHSNDNIKPIQKLYFLKQAMVGAAENILKDYTLQEGLYEEAWNAVKSRYYNRRAIIADHFQELMALPPISQTSLRESLDQVNAIIRGLKVCGLNTEAMSPLFTYIIVGKLPEKLRMDWENSVVDNSTYPSFAPLSTFLQNRCFAYESVHAQQSLRPTVSRAEAPEARRNRKFVAATAYNSRANSVAPRCVLCDKGHYLSQCPQFITKNIADRWRFVKDKRLCINCLRQFHFASDCNSSKCRRCNKTHHTMLHQESSHSVPYDRGEQSSSTTRTALACTSHESSVVLLPSAVVHVLVGSKVIKARALLDPCSQVNLVAESFVKKNRIASKAARAAIACVSPEEAQVSASVSLDLRSRYNSYQLDLQADVVGRIPYEVSPALIRRVKDVSGKLDLADCLLPTATVDILIGGNHANKILLGRKLFVGELCFEETLFGWVAEGPLSKFTSVDQRCCHLTSEVEDLIAKFWQIEEVQPSKTSQTEQELCEAHFEATHTRQPNGQFQVRLPLKRSIESLADTYAQARNSLFRAESKYNGTVRSLYTEFMIEYRELGNMEVVPKKECLRYFIPHFPVLRPDSSTTKLRVVFNASAKNATGISLNEALLNGPVVQPELFDILVHFRTYKVAFSADVSKMYRCISLHPDDRFLQSILWRDSRSKPIQTYQLTTLTYGTTSASFIATKCLQVLAQELASGPPEIACALSSEFYMDDLLTGARSPIEAIHKREKIQAALDKARFPLRKYVSNSKEFLSSLDESSIEELRSVDFTGSNAAKILGLQWHPSEDCFSINVKLARVESLILTKRVVSSLIARIFDPLGFLSPITVRAKLLLQELWREGREWDEPISEELGARFRDYYAEMKALPQFTIRRCYFQGAEDGFDIVGFCDASSRAYGAVVYVRVRERSKTYARLVCAKTRIAPLKEVTIPRLELLGAVLLAQLIARVATTLKYDVHSATAFCDSTIVLTWLKGPSAKYHSFVKNRVDLVTAILPAQQWQYVKSVQNPADLVTRGISVQALLDSPCWLNGPSWLSKDSIRAEDMPTLGQLPEVRNVTVCHAAVSSAGGDEALIERFSDFEKLLRIVRRLYEFALALRPWMGKREAEKDCASPLYAVCRISQRAWFGEELAVFHSETPLPARSSLIALNPFIDDNGLLRVGGRLRNSYLSYAAKHPIILHRRSKLTELLVRSIHEKHYHATRSFTLAFLQSKFWIHGGAPKLIKKIVGACVWCARLKAESISQIMGELPKERTSIARPFTHTGVDFAGPFIIKCTNHRSMKHQKYYAAFFACLSTRAVHIEAVADLSTEAFLATLQRFSARRGVPSTIWPDNATNFIGARSVLERHCQEAGITWKLIPARSPHHGGVWEAAIKAGKKLLLSASQGTILTAEQLNTVLTRIEEILNSRPLYRRCATSDPEVIDIVTPGHFLVGSNLLEADQPEQGDLLLDDRLDAQRRIVGSFWRMWSRNYLAQLQTRSKWQSEQPSVAPGDVVLLKDESSPLQWPVGRVINVFPDSQGRVRIAEISAKGGTFRRAVQKLIRLPVNANE